MSADRRVALCAVVVAVLSVPALVRAVRSVPSHASLDRNEGWNAYLADRVANALALYPDPPRFFVNNYPPLSFFVTGRLGPADRIAGGRGFSIAAFVVWAAMLGATAWRLGATPPAAWFGASLFVAMMLSTTSYVGMNDPQMLGHAVQAIGLYALAERRSLWRTSAAAVLLAAGVFVKQNLFALPLAATAWLFTVRRHDGWQLAIAGAVCAIAGLVSSIRVFGAGFLPQILMPRDYAFADTARGAATWVLRMPVLLALVALLWKRARHDAPAAFAAIYATISAVSGLVLFGGADVDWNVLFDANAACCLAAAIALGRIRAERRALVAAACLLLPMGGALTGARAESLSRDYWIAPHAAEAAMASADVEFVRAHPGPALCADLAFCWRAGKDPEVDTFGLAQRGERDPALLAELARLVDNRYFSVMQIGAGPPRLGAAFDAALRERYVVDHEDRYGTFLVVRPPR